MTKNYLVYRELNSRVPEGNSGTGSPDMAKGAVQIRDNAGSKVVIYQAIIKRLSTQAY